MISPENNQGSRIDSEAKKNDCYFCRDFGTPSEDAFFLTRHPELSGKKTRILKETEDFWLFPDMSPVALHHVVVAPKEHFFSFASIPPEYSPQFAEIFRLFKSKIKAREYFMFEHGMGTLQGEQTFCGNSVFHAHLHIVPVLSEDRGSSVLDQACKEARTIFGCEGRTFSIKSDSDLIPDLAKYTEGKPYLFLSDGGRGAVFVENEDIKVPSQFLRRVGAEVLSGLGSYWDRKSETPLAERVYKERVQNTFKRWFEDVTPLSGAIYDFSGVSWDNVKAVRKEFAGYKKLESILMLKSLDFPVSDGIVVREFNKDIYTLLNQMYAGQVFGLRTDKRAESLNLPRGGYDVRVEDLDKILPGIVKEGRIAILLKIPPGENPTRYDHIYSMNFHFIDGIFLVEIVGQGFDTSDLNRGDISPHQVLEIPLSDIEDFDYWTLKRSQRKICSPVEYQCSIRHRLAKIGRGKTEGGISSLSFDQAVEKGLEFLKNQDKRLLVENNDLYKPIPLDLLKRVLSYVCLLPESMSFFGQKADNFVLGCSIYNSGQIKFWDIVFPEQKFNIRRG